MFSKYIWFVVLLANFVLSLPVQNHDQNEGVDNVFIQKPEGNLIGILPFNPANLPQAYPLQVNPADLGPNWSKFFLGNSNSNSTGPDPTGFGTDGFVSTGSNINNNNNNNKPPTIQFIPPIYALLGK